MKYTRMILFLLVFIISTVSIVSIMNKSIMNKSILVNPCEDTLTDEEYIQHMIPHHEVAVYMSQNHLNNTTNPIILNILRNIIRIQTYEINMMKDAYVNDINDEMSLNDIKMNKTYKASQGDFTAPNKYAITNTFCDPSFFDINHNSHNLHHMTDAMYIKHMIPHHQVAVDMSKRILKTTTNDFIIYLAYRIIRAQQSEIAELYNLANSKYIYQSEILSL